MKNIVIDNSQLIISAKSRKTKTKAKKGFVLFDDLFKAQLKKKCKGKTIVSTFASEKPDVVFNKALLLDNLIKQKLDKNKNLYQSIAKNEYTKSRGEQEVIKNKKASETKNIRIIFPKQINTKHFSLPNALRKINFYSIGVASFVFIQNTNQVRQTNINSLNNQKNIDTKDLKVLKIPTSEIVSKEIKQKPSNLLKIKEKQINLVSQEKNNIYHRKTIDKKTNKQTEKQVEFNNEQSKNIKSVENLKMFEIPFESLYNQANVNNTYLDDKLSKTSNLEADKQNLLKVNQNIETDSNNTNKQNIQISQTIFSSRPVDFKKYHKHKLDNIKVEKTATNKKEIKNSKTFTFENVEDTKISVKLENNSQILNKNTQQMENFIDNSIFITNLTKQENTENLQTEEQIMETVESSGSKELIENTENKEFLKQTNLRHTIEKIENMKKLATKHISLKIVSKDLVLRANLTNQKLNISMLINEGIYDTFYKDVENIIKETGFEEYSLKIKTQKEVKSFRKARENINIRA